MLLTTVSISALPKNVAADLKVNDIELQNVFNNHSILIIVMCCVFHVPIHYYWCIKIFIKIILQSIEASDRGDIETARKQGRKALYLDLAAIFVPIGIGIIAVILYFFVGLIAVGANSN